MNKIIKRCYMTELMFSHSRVLDCIIDEGSVLDMTYVIFNYDNVHGGIIKEDARYLVFDTDENKTEIVRGATLLSYYTLFGSDKTSLFMQDGCLYNADYYTRDVLYEEKGVFFCMRKGATNALWYDGYGIIEKNTSSMTIDSLNPVAFMTSVDRHKISYSDFMRRLCLDITEV